MVSSERAQRGSREQTADPTDLSWRAEVDPKGLPHRDGESRWSRADLDEVLEELVADIGRQQAAIRLAEHELADLRESGDGAGRDAADVGSSNFERDQEMALVHSAREMLEASQSALRAIRAGHYGSCENCGEPIGKGRLQAFPRASLCVTCKQREERR